MSSPFPPVPDTVAGMTLPQQHALLTCCQPHLMPTPGLRTDPEALPHERWGLLRPVTWPGLVPGLGTEADLLWAAADTVSRNPDADAVEAMSARGWTVDHIALLWLLAGRAAVHHTPTKRPGSALNWGEVRLAVEPTWLRISQWWTEVDPEVTLAWVAAAASAPHVVGRPLVQRPEDGMNSSSAVVAQVQTWAVCAGLSLDEVPLAWIDEWAAEQVAQWRVLAALRGVHRPERWPWQTA